MAQIVTITNPLTGQPAQVDQLDHTAQQIDDGLNIARGVSNPNLLDNWYFLNPINQRGVTSGNTTPGVYFIDRWITTYGSEAGKYSLDTDGVTLTPATGNSCAMLQRFENVSELGGKILTASVLLSDGTLFCGTVTRINGSLQWLHNGYNIALYINPSNEFTISIYVNPRTITAVKLELGDQQTLAHQDADGNWVLNEIPNYGEQLARCQRHQHAITAKGNNATIATGRLLPDQNIPVALPIGPLRANPANISSPTGLVAATDTFGGTTYPITSITFIGYNPGDRIITTLFKCPTGTVGTIYRIGLLSGNKLIFDANL